LSDPFAIQVEAGHDDNSPIAPVVRGRKYLAMPAGKYRTMPGGVDCGKVLVSKTLPAHGTSDELYEEVTDPAD
jgi:hypothetical protein